MRFNLIHRGAVGVALFAALVGAIAVAANGATSESVAVRQAACEKLQPEFDKIIASHSQDPAVKTMVERLASLDQVAGAVLRDLRLHQAKFANQNLATIGGSPADDDANQPVGATKIIEKYQAAFAPVLNLSSLPPSDQQTVQTYLVTAAHALETHIQSRGRTCISMVGADAPEILRLCFILPLLSSPVNQDLSAARIVLPSWMAHAEQVRMLEELAEQYGRPRLAFAMAHHGTSTTAPADVSAAYVAFVKTSADAMLRATQYKAALICLRDGIAIAETAKMDKARIELSFRVAEVLDSTDSAKAAAAELSHLQSICADPDDYGRASMLRLKYLYEAEEYQTVPSEAGGYVKDDRCAPYLPQIIYIAWVSCRRQQGADADTWRKMFLEKFPDNPLAADMYFAAAMDALAGGNYAEAKRLLQFIEYRFPNSKIIDKVRDIRQRLDTTVSGNDATTRTSAPASSG